MISTRHGIAQVVLVAEQEEKVEIILELIE